MDNVLFVSIGAQGRQTFYPSVGDEVLCVSPGGQPASESYILSALRRQTVTEPLVVSAEWAPSLAEFPFTPGQISVPLAAANEAWLSGSFNAPPPDNKIRTLTINRESVGAQIQGKIHLLAGDLEGSAVVTSFQDGRLQVIRLQPGDLYNVNGWRWYEPPILGTDYYDANGHQTAIESSLTTLLGAFLSLDAIEIFGGPALLNVNQRIMVFIQNLVFASGLGSVARLYGLFIDVGFFHNHALPVIPDFTPFRFVWREDDD